VKKVLIADDEPSIVTALEFLLARSGYEVLVARNGEEALRMVEAGPPDLLLLDVMMPLVSGFEVCRRIRGRDEWRHVKVVMLTAKGGEADGRKGIEAGADLYVTKPFANAELLRAVKRLLQPA
jgi:DNA-binding response OmpR family regulator